MTLQKAAKIKNKKTNKKITLKEICRYKKILGLSNYGRFARLRVGC